MDVVGCRPGAYGEGNSWIKQTSRYQAPSPKQRLQYERVSNPPSIPARHQSYGYEEAASGRLVRQGSPERVVTGAWTAASLVLLEPGLNRAVFALAGVWPCRACFTKSLRYLIFTKRVTTSCPPCHCLAGVGVDRVGPGQYDPSLSAVIGAKAFTFGNSRTKRGLSVASNTPGPGAYELRKVRRAVLHRATLCKGPLPTHHAPCC